MFLSKLKQPSHVNFLHCSFPDLLSLLRFGEAVQFTEYVDQQHMNAYHESSLWSMLSCTTACHQVAPQS